jgi:HEAT repeat protein
LLDLFRSAPLPVALAAGDALAFHAALEATRPEIERFVAAEAPVVRLNGWRLVGYLGSPVSAEHLGAAMRDEPGVRRAALEAGAWCREAGVLRAARKLAEAPAAENLDALELLAILGEERDLPVMEGVAAARELGAVRYRVLGAFGHPALVEAILEGLEDPDPVVAGAAAAAFTKLTGQDIGSERYVSAEPRPGAASEEAGGAEPVWQAPVRLPDPARARAHWREAGGRFAGSARICRGFDLARGLGVEEFAALDMESRWEVCLRARFAGVWSGTALSLEVFPQYGGR